jgi:hypothetical protein
MLIFSAFAVCLQFKYTARNHCQLTQCDERFNNNDERKKEIPQR